MKKVILSAMLFAFSWQVHAQTYETFEFRRHELKGDAAYLINGTAKVEYEYWLNNFSTIGAVGLYNFYSFSSNEPDYKTQILGTYRLFFGKQPMKGFFFEYNLGVTSGKYYEYNYSPGSQSRYKPYTAFGMGLAIGWKFHILPNDVVLDLFFGLGRLFNEKRSLPESYPRVGVLLGKRFGTPERRVPFSDPGTPTTTTSSKNTIEVPSL
jgi:hypothetical protein